MSDFFEMIRTIKALKHQSLNQSEQVVKIEMSEFYNMYVYRLSMDYGRGIVEHWNTKYHVNYSEWHLILYADALIAVSSLSMHVVAKRDDTALKWSLVDSYELRGNFAKIQWIR